MEKLLARLTVWWEALVHPDCAGRLVLEVEAHPGFSRFLAVLIALLYALYGFSMGVFRGWVPGVVACAKLPFLFFLTLAVCFPAFYALNCLYGPALRARQCLRLLLMAISANAAALASYALFSFFFTFTTSRHGYQFLVLMHVAVFGLAGVASLVVIALVFRATAARLGCRLRPLFVLAWGVLYAFVGTQMAWVLRPWIGSWTVPSPTFPPAGGVVFAGDLETDHLTHDGVGRFHRKRHFRTVFASPLAWGATDWMELSKEIKEINHARDPRIPRWTAPLDSQWRRHCLTLPAGRTATRAAGRARAPYDPAQFPKGFWKRIDYLLHHPEEVFESLKQDRDLWPLSRIFFTISLLMAALYGAVMGATNLLQNSPDMLLEHKLLLILVVGIKTPVLFLLTLLIVIPPVYVSNAFLGTRYSFRQVLTLLLATVAITSTVLASMATVAFFFALTSQSYDFIKLLHVLFFAYAGVMGLAFLEKCLGRIAAGGQHRTPRKLLVMWLLLYIFVGTQLAWVLRPFVGSPNEEFQLFRPREGNFYESVIQSIQRVHK